MMDITPMSPKLLEFNYVNDDKYIYQIKWDGVRILACKINNEFKLINKNRKDKSKQFPEILFIHHIKKDFIIDGEAMIVDGNKNSFSKILKRNMTTDTKKISYYASNLPVTYAIFDILYYDGNWLLNEPIENRQNILNDLLVDSPLIHISKNYFDAVELYQTTKILGLEGIIAKKKGGKYIQGKKSYDWIKYKHNQQIKALVGGIFVENETIKSIAMGIYDQGNFIYVGNVGTGLSTENKKAILKKSINIVRTDSPFMNFNDKKHIWIEPTVQCYIEFMEWTDDYTLRSPVFKRILEV